MPRRISELIEDLKKRLSHKKKDELDESLKAVDDLSPDEEKPGASPTDGENPPDDETGDMTLSDSGEDKAKKVKSKVILAGLAAIGFVVMAGITYKIASPPEKIQQDSQLPQPKTAKVAQTPASELPGKYSDIAKYNTEKNKGNLKTDPTTGPRAPVSPQINNNQSPNRYAPQPSSSRPSSSSSQGSYSSSSVSSVSAAPASSSPRISDEEKQRRDEDQKAIESAISFAFGSGRGTSSASGESSTPEPVSVSSSDGSSSTAFGASYDLQAGAVIQATLLTGITTDQPGGDVVAQVRQNVYDSLTGEHLLIPQGAKLIGKYGNAGSRGNDRVGVAFSRIILPTGESIALPDQKAIDSIGYQGLRDQYTEHTGKLFGATFMSALISAAAQSATGNSSGTDNRSPGQEAVSGAVADVLDSVKAIIDRQAQVAPTATIRPGYEFSIFINKDLSIPEYLDAY